MSTKSSVAEAEHEPLYRFSDEDIEKSDRLTSEPPAKQATTSDWSRAIPLLGCILIIYLSMVCSLLALRIRDLDMKLQDLQENDKCVMPTDLHDAVRYIDYEERVFTGAIAFNHTPSGIEAYHDLPEAGPRYFGDPEVHPEIDENWRDLLGNEFFTLTPDEAKQFPAEDFTGLAAISVYHGLHCINAIRIHMDKEYYLKHGGLHQDGPGYPSNFSRVHMSHCLDQVRQLIQCSGDLSLVPLYRYEDINIDGKSLKIAQGSRHTCRNFEKVKLWMIDREMSGISVSEYPAI